MLLISCITKKNHLSFWNGNWYIWFIPRCCFVFVCSSITLPYSSRYLFANSTSVRSRQQRTTQLRLNNTHWGWLSSLFMLLKCLWVRKCQANWVIHCYGLIMLYWVDVHLKNFTIQKSVVLHFMLHLINWFLSFDEISCESR